MPAKPGGYVSALSHPEPLDPNDRQRQMTQARAKTFPYDQDISYGQPESPDDAGAKYQDGGWGGQLTPWFVKDDDGDIEHEHEAIGTPYNFAQSDGGGGGGTIPGQSRGFAGSNKTELDLPDQEVFGEEDIDFNEDEDGWPQVVRSSQLRSLMSSMFELEGMSLGECFAVNNEESDEVLSLLERLDWEG